MSNDQDEKFAKLFTENNRNKAIIRQYQKIETELNEKISTFQAQLAIKKELLDQSRMYASQLEGKNRHLEDQLRGLPVKHAESERITEEIDNPEDDTEKHSSSLEKYMRKKYGKSPFSK